MHWTTASAGFGTTVPSAVKVAELTASQNGNAVRAVTKSATRSRSVRDS